MTPPETEALGVVNAALGRLHEDIADVRDRVTELSDRINAYHGETVSAADCSHCQGKWVDKRFFAVGLTVATAIISLVAGLRGLL